MSTHTRHVPIREGGLANDCPRCAEHAAHPFDSLDADNLRALVHRTSEWMSDREFPRSDTELAAMRVAERVIIQSKQLAMVWPLVSNDPTEVEEAARRDADGPTDDEVYNRAGVEGGIAYDIGGDEPGSLGENDWRL